MIPSLVGLLLLSHVFIMAIALPQIGKEMENYTFIRKIMIFKLQ